MLKDGGLLIASFFGSGLSDTLAQEEWVADRIGMNVLRYGQSWDQGGLRVFLSPWMDCRALGTTVRDRPAPPRPASARRTIAARCRE